MGSVILFIAVVVIVALWVRGTMGTRRRWLQQLNLPGQWQQDDDAQRCLLELRGDLTSGDYSVREDNETQRGRWRLIGHTLTLIAEDDQPQDYELRLFDAGKIGIDGPGRIRQIFIKRPDNVVPLRARS